ncbi:MAG: HAMP domain-containing histidine kinase [Oscillospiraceae bacterium]|nr:HAMP domain-containing histidine kinase [Oscillospiraceae bacterium]
MDSTGKSRLKLKWKIFAFLLGFCALLLSILWLFQTVFLNDIYKFIRRQELKQAITEVEREMETKGENADLEGLLIRIQEEKDIMVAFTIDYTTVIFRPDSQNYQIERRDFTVISERRESEVITDVREYKLQNGGIISLTFYAVIVPVEATVSTLRTQLYFITAAMVVLSVLLAFIIARRVSKPIEIISKNALMLARGNYDVRFKGEGFREITALSDTLNTTAAELRRVEALRRELLANVSHDLRTPLALIYSYAEMMSDFPEEITVEQLKMIMNETLRLTTLVNDVLDISKIENDMEHVNITRFNLTESVLATVQNMQELLKNSDYKIIFKPGAQIYINADETKINRAFYNLLINAVNYSGENRTVIVKQEIMNNRVRISVTDSGGGIASEELHFIWDRYYKSGKAHKRAVTGTGLGLSIVKKIIELHGGFYGVESEIGKGSTFWFEIDNYKPS